MDNNSKTKLKDILSTIDPVEFKWEDNNMNSTGFMAQEVDSTTYTSDGDMITLSGSYDTVTIGPIGTDFSGNSVLMSSGNAINWNTQPSYTIGTGLSINQDGGKNYIQTSKNKIDLDELAEMMETLKKRLLILTPNFEQMEKYPMLKELYDEYKAMEKLLSGPDNTSEEQ
jgi:hypothetical protein